MKKKIFKYFACMIAVAIVVTTVLLSWVNYGMFQNRVMDDLRTYGRVFSSILPDSEGTAEGEAFARLTKEGLRVTLVHPDGSVYYDNFADPKIMENHAGARKYAMRWTAAREAASAIPIRRTAARFTMPCGWKTATFCGWRRKHRAYGASICDRHR